MRPSTSCQRSSLRIVQLFPLHDNALGRVELKGVRWLLSVRNLRVNARKYNRVNDCVGCPLLGHGACARVFVFFGSVTKSLFNIMIIEQHNAHGAHIRLALRDRSNYGATLPRQGNFHIFHANAFCISTTCCCRRRLDAPSGPLVKRKPRLIGRSGCVFQFGHCKVRDDLREKKK